MDNNDIKLFKRCLRESLLLSCKTMNINKKEKLLAAKAINEMKDYNIFHLALTGKVGNKDITPVEEMLFNIELSEQLNEMFNNDSNFLVESKSRTAYDMIRNQFSSLRSNKVRNETLIEKREVENKTNENNSETVADSLNRSIDNLTRRIKLGAKEVKIRAIQKQRSSNPLYKVNDTVRNYVVNHWKMKNADDIEKAQKVGSAAGVISTGLLAAGILYGGYKLYKRFFSADARKCSNYSGEEFKSCIRRVKIKALEAQILELKKSKKYCDQASNKQKCLSVIDEKIRRLQDKIASVARS